MIPSNGSLVKYDNPVLVHKNTNQMQIRVWFNFMIKSIHVN